MTNTDNSYSRMIPSIVKLASSLISGGGFARATPERIREMAMGSIFVLLDETTTSLFSSLQDDC